ncbi:MAG: hypothetical protein K2H19_04425 [Ruminococcus sp.]|nr:hypothetical protein [Ruminococcus sp.]
MSYLGENKYFSFRDGYCEVLPKANISSKEAAELGRTIAGFFTRFSIGCSGFERLPILYALCSGISECGKDVYVCENTDMPSFRFGFPLLSSDCGIFISDSAGLKFSFFDKSGFTLPESLLSKIMNSTPQQPSERSGKIHSATSFKSIYINHISDSLGKEHNIISAGISCGNKNIRSLWLEFFSGENDTLVFQISDDGQRVNAYSTELGFISYEKLTLAYCLKLINSGGTVWLPENFHYAADYLESGIKRFNTDTGIPDDAENVRFLHDTLYMCVHLASDKNEMTENIKKLPKLASAKREITVSNMDNLPLNKVFSNEKGRVIITPSGKNRISLLAQTLSSETATELCSVWTEKLRRHNL